MYLHKKLYYVQLNKAKIHPDGGWCNYICTPHIGRARHYVKKLKRGYRQIDVREMGKLPYVLKGSWL